MAQSSVPVSVTIGASALLWQTSTGVPPDPKTTKAGNATAQIFQAGTFNDPVPIIIQNLDPTNAVFLGGSGVTAENGSELEAGASITRNVVGNDSEFAIAVGGTVSVSVEVGRQ